MSGQIGLFLSDYRVLLPDSSLNMVGKTGRLCLVLIARLFYFAGYIAVKYAEKK